MFVKFKAAGFLLGLLCGAASAQTIDEIAELNRQATLAEAKAKIETAKKSGNSTPGPVPGPAAPGAPMGASAQPGALPVPPAPMWKPIPAKTGRSRPPVLVAIYGVGHSLMAELSEDGQEGKYREGDKTPSGWIVSRIDKRNVDVTRNRSGKGKHAKAEKVSLPFGAKTEVTKEIASAPREQVPGNYSMPPLPPSFPAGR